MLEQIKDLILAFPPAVWTLFGASLILLRLIFFPRRQLTLAGLGALTVAALVSYDLVKISDFFTQFVAFFSFTIFWSLALWLPFTIRDYFFYRYRHLVGSKCEIAEDTLHKGKKGKAIVNGVLMEAKMQPDSAVDIIAEGEEARITKTEYATVFVEPTSIPMPTDEELESYRKHVAANPLRQEK